MTLTGDALSWSRRQSTNAFKAALDAEYAGRLTAGTIARLEPVLSICFRVVCTSSENGTYYIKLVSVFLPMRKGRNFIVKSTKQEKLVVISE